MPFRSLNGQLDRPSVSPAGRTLKYGRKNIGWIDRTLAGSSLAANINKLQADGWRCHVVAHSHGGNVVVEALPQIEPLLNKPSGLSGTIVVSFEVTLRDAAMTFSLLETHQCRKAPLPQIVKRVPKEAVPV